jgi:hypothetical protein
MAYVGTPIDTRNQFQSLQGKRFNGDGSTTDFTLDVAPSSTLDIEVFVGNVRQDPNSAYTLSGTTLSFTGAPPSGTNNIYVVHQAKAVGTITPPDSSITSDKLSGNLVTPGTFDVNGQELILDADADTSITADTDDQIDIKIAGADDFQFTANTFTAQSGSTITTPTLGVINAHDLGAGIHIKTADSGASVSSEADELVIEHGNAIGGMSFLAATDGLTKIAFGDSGNNDAGIIHYSHDNTTMAFTTEGTERMSIDGSGVLKVNSRMFVDGQIDAIAKINAVFGGDNENGMQFSDKDGATNGKFIGFSRDGTSTSSQGTQMGFIARNGSSDAINYSTSSDYRLKDGIVDKTDGIEKLKQLQPRKFYWKSDLNKTLVDGFLAHEVSSIVPEAIIGEKDATEKYTDENGDEQTRIIAQGIDQGKLTPLLTAALKEAITKIETLETKVKALEEA